jgi:hypothetical protein
MRVNVAVVEGASDDSGQPDFTLEAIPQTNRCRLSLNVEEFTIEEWRTFNGAVEAAFLLITAEG